MKKLMFLGIVILLGVSFSSCGTMNTRFRPYTAVRQNNVEGLQSIVTRADRSGIYIAFKNKSTRDLEILWSQSTLGGDNISQGDASDSFREDVSTVLKPGEIFQTVLHRKSDMYYMDPALYQPGGIKIKELKYPVSLILQVREGATISNLEMEIQQEESLYMKDVEARTKTKHLIPEFIEKTIELREDQRVIKRF
ncbi:hypothetical protein C4N15_09870 [Fusobacterium necrophorum subsp. funduliforme]|uniref:hypothetical protein n=1 Tax=Fusobacterium necrophorum TaxID=859 RepID=UPI000245DB05|nr:hypothetical protein [Fusobacterium necrophorum]AVQ21934.1 hypothetical protein C4N15_09870 [Fusobacterium necrophorum subsp. funduliforme]EHO18438.1 hypothetical protein HMPREF9466_02395 [Fusobacterium necrophorum subsp. funduliforme 1_1_36S]